MTNLHEVSPGNESDRNTCIPSHTTIVILGNQVRLTVGAEQLHHDVRLPTGLNDMTALSGHCKCEEVLLPWLANRSRRATVQR